MAALVILAFILLALSLIYNRSYREQDAQNLAKQSLNFANVFITYMQNNQTAIKQTAFKSGIVVLTPETLQNQGQWPDKLAMTNHYEQKPCVIILANAAANKIEALMYFVGGAPMNLTTARLAAINLQAAGGLVKQGNIIGNALWSVKQQSPFLTNAAKCGANISSNSLSLNLDLLPNWNNNLQPPTAILRGLYQGESNNITDLPTHYHNANTVNSDLYVDQNSGIIFNLASLAKLVLKYNSSNPNSATLNFSNTSGSTTIVADTLQPTQQYFAGEDCSSDEIGTVVAEKAAPTQLGALLARNTLVCTHNSTLCKNSTTCYLPTTKNNVIFQNGQVGIQDNNGNFICPNEIPYAVNQSNNSGTIAGYYYATNANDKLSCSYSSKSLTCLHPQFYTNSCQLPFAFIQGCLDQLGVAIVSFGQNVSSRGKHAIFFNNIYDGNAKITPIIGFSGDYEVAIGYNISNITGQIMCQRVCAQLPATTLGSWQVASNDPIYLNTTFGNNSCGCRIRSANGDWLALAIAVVESQNSVLTSVTCANSPIYNARN